MDSEGSIGETLRLRRESRGLSVEQAAFQGKVPLRLVHALESDDYRTVPDAFYLIRVLHEYARFLELDADSLEGAFRTAIQRHAKTGPPPSAPAPQISVSWRHLLWIAGGILVVLPLVFIALSLSSRQELPTGPVPPSPAARSEARVEAVA
ncbi:MAG: helix-turn-helix domain-containing protein, partial [Candidatus Methylomirabilota bacterium]